MALALLAGLFAMHGLTHHGEHLPSTATVAGHHEAGSTGDGDDGSAAMAMCLAVLLGVVVGALLVARRRVGRPQLLPRVTSAGALLRALLPQVHDPPTPWSLSVYRC